MAFVDNFTDVDATALSSHTPDTGTGWTESNTGYFKIYNNAVRAQAAVAATAICDDQGSANHETGIKNKYFSTALQTSYGCINLVDTANFIGYRIYGTGTLGRRFTSVVAGTATDLSSTQSVSAEWVKVTRKDSATLQFWQGGTGASPSWVQIGSDYSNSDHSTETSQGLVSNQNVTQDWFDAFTADPVAAGGVTGTLAITLDDITAAMTGIIEVTGTLATTLDSITIAASGTFTSSSVTGTLAITLDSITPAFQGVVEVTGSLSATLDSIAVAFSGSVTNAVTGTFDIILDGIGFTATGSIGGWVIQTKDDTIWTDQTKSTDIWTLQ